VLRRASLARALGASRSIAGFTGALKRLSDIALASVGLLIAFPAMLWIAAVAKVQDGGPAIFRQVRVGRDGKPFTMLKFRTMVVDAEARQADLIALSDGHGAFFKLRHDPRSPSSAGSCASSRSTNSRSSSTSSMAQYHSSAHVRT
jgi:lipopolysaccharide/colanic/teichoic acid biosynthesis glycosyltransferase